MSPTEKIPVSWIVLTTGGRPAALQAAVESLDGDGAEIVVISNGGGEPGGAAGGATVVVLDDNVGIPAGRDAGVRATDAAIVGFLDDDAVAPPGITARVREAFAADSRLGAVAFRLVDEDGVSARRHVPRPGSRRPERSGPVALFLGGACAIRRSAYDDVGGYFAELFYGHEEVELCWRLIDGGWRIRYLADVEVFHPRTTIERHPEGWERTGRNRVLIARRTLPRPLSFVHTVVWLALGSVRAPGGEERKRYVSGWWRGWRIDVERRPISWGGVWRLTRLGRPPIV